MPRDIAARLGRATVDILRAGTYVAPSGRKVDLWSSLKAARKGTVEYAPRKEPRPAPRPRARARITVENATVLEVGRRLATKGPVAALNFASATHPGGGFLTGARAQEESIARSSGLFHCLDGLRMYDYHRETDAMYSDYVVYSPGVPVFRVDAGKLLEKPWSLNVLTSPAVNGKALSWFAPERLPEIPDAMRSRTAKVLRVAVAHGQRRLILGAWGGGAFGLDVEMIAGIFFDALHGPFAHAFKEIVFAVTDFSDDDHFIGPFRRRFAKRPSPRRT